MSERERYLETIFRFRERAEGNVQEVAKLIPSLSRCSLDDIRRCRKRSAPKL